MCAAGAADLAEAEALVERPIEHDDLLGEEIVEEEEAAVQQQVMQLVLQVLLCPCQRRTGPINFTVTFNSDLNACFCSSTA